MVARSPRSIPHRSEPRATGNAAADTGTGNKNSETGAADSPLAEGSVAGFDYAARECEKSITFYHLRRSSSGHFGSGDSSAQIAIGQTDVAAVAGI